MRAERRPGFTLVEVVIALLACALLGGLALRGYAAVASANRRLGRTCDELWALRAIRWGLREELAAGVAGRDWSAHPPDSIRLRAFRSTALVCAAGADSSVVVIRYGGRRPDPSKDSVLVLAASGGWSAAGLDGVAQEGCPAGVHGGRPSGAAVERWRLSEAATGPVLVRLYERGSYHLTGRALRYRRGGGGRQPLTAEVLDGARLVDTLGWLRVSVPRVGRPPLDLSLVPTAPVR